MTQALGGTVSRTDLREYGRTALTANTDSLLFAGLPPNSRCGCHGARSPPPRGFVDGLHHRRAGAAFEDTDAVSSAFSSTPSAAHRPRSGGAAPLPYEGAGCRPTWTMVNIVEEQVERIRAQIGSKRVICGLSGGVDSAVAGALVQRAVGDQLTCVFVDHGLLRKGEAEQVEKDFVAATGVQLKVVDAADRFLAALDGVTDPEQKRKIIGREFIRVFEAAAREIDAERHVDFLVQGTLYPDVVESGGATHREHQAHHNVGGYPTTCGSRCECCANCSRTRCARSARSWARLRDGLASAGPALGIRIIGEVTRNLEILREADAIAREG